MDAPLRILAVDNEPTITLSMRFVFNGPGYEMTCVGDGKSALARLDANSNLYDVIIVDHRMPNMTGLELVRAIRARGVSGKIIVVSAFLTSEICEAYSRMEVHMMFSKPFNVEDLRAAVDRVAV